LPGSVDTTDGETDTKDFPLLTVENSLREHDIVAGIKSVMQLLVQKIQLGVCDRVCAGTRWIESEDKQGQARRGNEFEARRFDDDFSELITICYALDSMSSCAANDLPTHLLKMLPKPVDAEAA
jgi:hypothetical protein